MIKVKLGLDRVVEVKVEVYTLQWYDFPSRHSTRSGARTLQMQLRIFIE